MINFGRQARVTCSKMPRLTSASHSILRSCTCQLPTASTSTISPRWLNTLVPALPEAPYNPNNPSGSTSAADHNPVQAGLARFDPKYDVHPSKNWVTPNGLHEIFIINDPPPSSSRSAKSEDDPQGVAPDQAVLQTLANSTEFTLQQLRDFHKYPLVIHRVASMTDKGKQLSMYALVVAGNGNGLLGVGEGKHENVAQAIDKAFSQAVKNIGVVERFDERTVWGDRNDKYGATQISMWSRPPGERTRSFYA